MNFWDLNPSGREPIENTAAPVFSLRAVMVCRRANKPMRSARGIQTELPKFLKSALQKKFCRFNQSRKIFSRFKLIFKHFYTILKTDI